MRAWSWISDGTKSVCVALAAVLLAEAGTGVALANGGFTGSGLLGQGRDGYAHAISADNSTAGGASSVVGAVPESSGPALLLCLAVFGVVLAVANRLRGDMGVRGSDNVEIFFRES